MQITHHTDASLPELISGDDACKWLNQRLGLKCGLKPHTQMQILRFSRYSSNEDAIVLLPETHAEFLRTLIPEPLGTSQSELEKTPKGEAAAEKSETAESAEGSGGAYQPQKRVRSAKTSRREGLQCVFQKTSALEISLLSTPTRSSHWGMDIQRLLTLNLPEDTPYSVIAEANGFGHEALRFPEETAVLLEGAYALARAKLRQRTPALAKLRLPLIHNQRDGQRYILSADKKNLGSPAMLHVLAYPNDARPPRLSGWVGSPRPEPTERKNGLLLHGTVDKRIRFYFPTLAQWNEWRESPGDWQNLSAEISTQVASALVAARKIAERLGYR